MLSVRDLRVAWGWRGVCVCVWVRFSCTECFCISLSLSVFDCLDIKVHSDLERWVFRWLSIVTLWWVWLPALSWPWPHLTCILFYVCDAFCYWCCRKMANVGLVFSWVLKTWSMNLIVQRRWSNKATMSHFYFWMLLCTWMDHLSSLKITTRPAHCLILLTELGVYHILWRPVPGYGKRQLYPRTYCVLKVSTANIYWMCIRPSMDALS